MFFYLHLSLTNGHLDLSRALRVVEKWLILLDSYLHF